MIKKLSLLAASLVLAGSASGAPVEATTAVFSLNSASPTVVLSGTPASGSVTGTLSKFDNNGGDYMLTKATLTLSGNFVTSGELKLRDTAGSPVSGVNVSNDVGVTFLSSLVTLLPDFIDLSGNGTSGSNGEFSFGDNQFAISQEIVDISSLIALTLGNTQDPFAITCNFAGNFLTDSDPQNNNSQETKASCSASIQYTYEYEDDAGGGGNNDIPEPSSLALMGLALAGLSVAARRRKG